jgi:hypothetical protein
VEVAFQDSRPLKLFIHRQLTLGILEFAPDAWLGDLAHFDRQRENPNVPNFKCSLPAICVGFQTHNYCSPPRGASCEAKRTRPPKIIRFLLRKLQKLQYSQLYRLIAQASTHLLGTTPVGVSVTSSERLGPLVRSNGRIAVLARRPPKNH